MSEYTKLGKVKCIQSIRKHKYKRALIDRSQIWWLDDGDHGWVMGGLAMVDHSSCLSFVVLLVC